MFNVFLTRIQRATARFDHEIGQIDDRSISRRLTSGIPEAAALVAAVEGMGCMVFTLTWPCECRSTPYVSQNWARSITTAGVRLPAQYDLRFVGRSGYGGGGRWMRQLFARAWAQTTNCPRCSWQRVSWR